MVLAYPYAWTRFEEQRRALGAADGQEGVVPLVRVWAEIAGLTERFVQRNAERLFALEICSQDTGEVAPEAIAFLERGA